MTAALMFVIVAVAGAAVGRAVRGPRPQPTVTAGVVPTAFRYCPREFRTRSAVEHTDGTATCADCGAHIPAAIEEVTL